MISILLLLSALLALLSILYWSLRNGISPTPSSAKQIQEIMNSLPRDFSGTVYDLGSGWGHLAFRLARHLPHCKVIGIENSPIPFMISYLLLRIANIRNLSFIRRDFHDVPLVNASLIVCYLYPGGMKKLEPKLKKELSPDALVISNTFAVPGWEPVEVRKCNDLYQSTIYIYTPQRHKER